MRATIQKLRMFTVVGTAVALGLAGAPALAQEKWAAPAEAKTLKPAKGLKPSAAAGRKAYETNCQICHGPKGFGDGPGAAALNPKPASFKDKAVQAQTDGELFWKISEGRGVMAPWKHLSEAERWSLVQYVRSLGK
jgi:mono/diheme cytochrome c family protein